jgi:hypothetical protein
MKHVSGGAAARPRLPGRPVGLDVVHAQVGRVHDHHREAGLLHGALERPQQARLVLAWRAGGAVTATVRVDM